MRAETTNLPGLIVMHPAVHTDDRGWFYESWDESVFNRIVGSPTRFRQQNHSRSARGVLRGLHYQLPRPQGKLVRCSVGAVWDVAVDLRQSSDTFGRCFGIDLTAENHRQLWIPEGFAHGFVVMSEAAEVDYLTTDFYDAACERSLRFDDPDLSITWPIPINEALLSAKDRAAGSFASAPLFA